MVSFQLQPSKVEAHSEIQKQKKKKVRSMLCGSTMLFRVHPGENWSVSIDLLNLQRPRALMKIIQRFIIIATDNNSFSSIIIEIISLSLLQQPWQVQRSVSLCQSADMDWRGGGGWGASSHVASRTVRDGCCSSQIRRCCSITGVISLGDPPYGCAWPTQSLLTVHKQRLFTINPLGPTKKIPPRPHIGS